MTTAPTKDEIRAARAKLKAATLDNDTACKLWQEAHAEEVRRRTAWNEARASKSEAEIALQAMLDFGKVKCGERVYRSGVWGSSQCSRWAQPETNPPRCGIHRGKR